MYVFILQSDFVFKQKFKFWNPLNIFVSSIGLLLNKSYENSHVFKHMFLKNKYTENVASYSVSKCSRNKLH